MKPKRASQFLWWGTLYIMSHPHSLLNSYYKIGVTSSTAERRAAQIQSGGSKVKVWTSWTLPFPYRHEWMLHRIFMSFHVQMPKGDGYTEYFDLNWVFLVVFRLLFSLYVLIIKVVLLTLFAVWD